MDATLEPRLVMDGGDGKPFVLSGQFFVAAYQRGYRWGRDEVRQLLDDILANTRAAEKENRPPSDYYLQPVVVLRRDDMFWELIDGQQRLTTLYLITKFVATRITGATVAYDISYETRDREGYSSSEFLRAVGTPAAEELRSDNIDFHHMALAYDTIEAWFAEQDDPDQSARDIHTALSTCVHVIWYEASSDTDPNELFVRLNRDRIPLTDSELIKALVLSRSRASDGNSDRRPEIAAQWDRFEQELRDPQFWAFLTGSVKRRSTHIDFLFEAMTPTTGLRSRPRYWTFGEVRQDVERRGAAAFWRDVVERHGLLTGWYHDRDLYHRIGYLVATGDSITDLIEISRSQTHSAFRASLLERTRRRLDLTASTASSLSYDKNSTKCTEVLLLMNVETVLLRGDSGNRFPFHTYATQGWSLEHIHAQNSEGLDTERERRDWIRTHLAKIEATAEPDAEVEAVIREMRAHLADPANRTNDTRFKEIVTDVVKLFSAPNTEANSQDMHGLRNLALLQRDFNSKLNNAVFAVKRERILELDGEGEYILPCTRNAFLKYYTSAADQQLSIWSPQDQDAYYDELIDKVRTFLLPESASSSGEASRLTEGVS